MPDKKKKKSLSKAPKMDEIIVRRSNGEKIKLRVRAGSSEEDIARLLAQIDGGPSPAFPEQAQPDSPEQLSSFRKFLRGATGSATPVDDALKGLSMIGESAARLSPLGLLIGQPKPEGALGLIATELPKTLIRGQAEQFEKAVEATIDPSTGKPTLSRFLFNPEVSGRLGAAALPVFGPAAANLADQVLSQNFAEPAGTFVNLLLGMGIPKVIGVVRARSLAKAPAKVTPRVFKAIKPPKNIRTRVQESLPFIIEEVKKLGTTINTMDDLNNAVHSIRQRIGSQINDVLARNKSAVIDGNRLADITLDSVDEAYKVFDSAAMRRIEESVNNAETGLRHNFTRMQAEKLRQSINNELSFFFKKNKMSQRAAARTPEIAHKLALRSA